MGDAEFGLRAYIKGFLSISNPEAMRIHLKFDTGGLRELGSWDAWRPTKLIYPRPIPSVLYFSKNYFGVKSTIKYLLVNIPFSLTRYRKKGRFLNLLFSLCLFTIFSPIIFIMVMWSWQISEKMLKTGPKIPTLD